MSLLKEITNKNLKLNKKRTVVTIIGIMLSVALITAVATLFVSFYKSLIHLEIEESGNYHISLNNVSKEDMKSITENKYIEKYYMTHGLGYSKLDNSKDEFKPYLYVIEFNKESLDNLGIRLISGRLPENEHEILISHHLKTEGRVDYNVGDKITLNIGKRMLNGKELTQSDSYEVEEDNIESEPPTENDNSLELPATPIKEEIVDTKEYTYTIVGIIERPNAGVEDFFAPGYTCITLNENISDNANLYIRLNKTGLKDSNKVIASILGVDIKVYQKLVSGFYTAEEYESLVEEMQNAKISLGANNRYLIMLESGIFKNRSFKVFAYIIAFISFIIVVTSVFCIKNSFDISIAEKTKQYGVLSSIGATKKQIRKNVYYEAFRLGAIGIPLGVLLGLLASVILIIICNLLLKDLLGAKLIFSTSFLAILFGIILGIVTIFFSSMYSANKASRITPLNAIRNSEDIKINPKKIKSPKIIKKIFGIGGEISYKNLKRNKKKYRTTVVSIIVCVSIYIALSTFMNTLYKYIVIEYSAPDYNLVANTNADDYDRIRKKLSEVFNREDVNDYATIESGMLFINNPKMSEKFKDNYSDNFGTGYDSELPESYKGGYTEVTRLGDHQYRKYLKELGLDYEYAKDKMILVNQVNLYAASEDKYLKVFAYNYKKGEHLKASKVESDENGLILNDMDFVLAEVTNEKPFAIEEYIRHTVMVVSDEMFRKIFGATINYEHYYFDAKDPDKLQDDLDVILADEDYEIVNIAEEQRQMKSLHLLIGIFLYGFIAVISLIGLTSVFNTITTNMELRKREFATLKSVGMTTKEFNRMISLESFFYGTKSLLIGIPIGVLLSYVLTVILNENGDVVEYQLPILSILLSIVLVFFLITIIMKYSITKINKQNTIETIRNENI